MTQFYIRIIIHISSLDMIFTGEISGLEFG
jgi:hypothetical protein